MTSYREFLAGKHVRHADAGFEAIESRFPAMMFDWQRRVVRQACKAGRYAIFADCGLGKTLMQLAWAEQAVAAAGAPALILCPLAVARQTVAEAAKFGIGVPVRMVREAEEVGPGINVCNYDRLHRLDCTAFGSVVLDESSVLKAFMGKTKDALCNAFAATPLRLCCTATPSPNDWSELGNHCEFLGLMTRSAMLGRWFRNDPMQTNAYYLMEHAAADFWRWVSSWAAAISTPADLGCDATGYDLPPLDVIEHEVGDDRGTRTLFSLETVSATGIQAEYRRSLDERVECVTGLTAAEDLPWVVWCHTDEESKALTKAIAGAVEVRGSHSPEEKEDRLAAFSEGRNRVIVTKPKLAGFGLNWQHCPRQAFASPSFSFESYYQCIRRSWRFGQALPVAVHCVTTPALQAARQRVLAKEELHRQMRSSLADALRQFVPREHSGLQSYSPENRMEIPSWLRAKSPSSIKSTAATGLSTGAIAARC